MGGRPTALWQPEIATSEANFGVRTNHFGLNIRWTCDMVIVINASKNLSSPVWSPVATNTLIDGSSYFSDSRWTNYPRRFSHLGPQ